MHLLKTRVRELAQAQDPPLSMYDLRDLTGLSLNTVKAWWSPDGMTRADEHVVEAFARALSLRNYLDLFEDDLVDTETDPGPHPISEEEWFWLLCAYEFRCAYCDTPWHELKRPLQKDHVIPINDPRSPGTILSNVVPSCDACNIKKHNRNPGEAGMFFARYVRVTF